MPINSWGRNSYFVYVCGLTLFSIIIFAHKVQALETGPFIDRIAGPLTAQMGVASTWHVYAYDLDSSEFTVNVTGTAVQSEPIQVLANTGQLKAGSVTITFTASGVQQFMVTVSDKEGHNATQTRTVIVSSDSTGQDEVNSGGGGGTPNIAPLIDRIVGPLAVPAGQVSNWTVYASDSDGASLEFTAKSGLLTKSSPGLTVTAGESVSYAFNFTFTELGSQTIEFTVTDNQGVPTVQSRTFFVTAPNQTPSIDRITGPLEATVGQVISWQVFASNADENSILGFTASVPGMATIRRSVIVTSGAQVSSVLPLSFALAGTYEITFSVFDQTGLSVSQKRTILVADGTAVNNPVIDRIAGPLIISPNENKPWTVYATDSEGGLLTFTAASSAFTTKILTISSTANAQVSQLFDLNFPVVGSYQITFTVANPRGGIATQTRTVVVSSASSGNVTPIIDRVAGSLSLTVGQGGAWQVFAYDPDGNSPLTFAVSGTGVVAAPVIVSSTAGQTVSGSFALSFSSVGTYQIIFSVTDALGAVATQTRTVAVVSSGGGGSNVTPVIDRIDGLINITVGEDSNWQVYAFDPDGSSLSFKLLGDGMPDRVISKSGATGETLSAIFPLSFASAGSYTLKFSVTDAQGGVASQDRTVAVTGRAPGGGGGGGGAIIPGPNASSVAVTFLEGQITDHLNVTLSLTYGSDVTTYAISNYADFRGALYETAASTHAWTLQPGTGNKTVYVSFRNQQGVSIVKSANILFQPGQGRVLGATACYNIVSNDKTLIKKISKVTTDRLKGRFLLTEGQTSEMWYVDGRTRLRYYIPSSSDAHGILKLLGVGISNTDLNKIPMGYVPLVGSDSDMDRLPDQFELAIGTSPYNVDTDGDNFSDYAEVLNGYRPNGAGKAVVDQKFSTRQRGRVFIAVQKNFDVWYVNPKDGKRYFLQDGNQLYGMLKSWGQNVSLSTLLTVPVADNIRGAKLADQYVCGTPRLPVKVAKKIVKPKVLGASTKKAVKTPASKNQACKVNNEDKIKQAEKLIRDLKKEQVGSCQTR